MEKLSIISRLSCGSRVMSFIKDDGSIISWGDDSGSGVLSGIPKGDFVQVSTKGGSSAMALRSNGEIVCWGIGHDYIPPNPGTRSNFHVPAPSDLTGFKYIASIDMYHFGIKDNGSLVGWGWEDGPAGLGSNIPSSGNFTQVICTRDWGMIVALKDTNQVTSWGYRTLEFPGSFTSVTGNGWYIVGITLRNSIEVQSIGTDAYNLQKHSPSGENFIKVACGEHHAMALRSDGTIVSWGTDEGGNPNRISNLVTDSPAGNDFIDIDCFGRNAMALKSDGTVVVWGDNSHGQLNIPSDIGMNISSINNEIPLDKDGYKSLIMYDSDGNQYTGDKGNVLKKLEFGILEPGSTSKEIPIVFKNTIPGSIIKNIRISQDTSSKNDVFMELTLADSIKWSNYLDLSSVTLNSGDEINVLVRIRAIGVNEVPNGEIVFDIRADTEAI